MSKMSLETSDTSRALPAAFDASEISWRATAISPDGTACEFTPSVMASAYQRRLIQALGHWGYRLRFLPTSRTGPEGVIGAECILVLPGIGSYRGVGEIPGGAENALSRAEAKAFQDACINAGVGKQLRPMWVAIDQHGHPKCLPASPASGDDLPRRKVPHQVVLCAKPAFSSEQTNHSAIAASIQAIRREVGNVLYTATVRHVGVTINQKEWSTAEQKLLLQTLKTVAHILGEAKAHASSMPEHQFYGILEDHGISSLLEISNLTCLGKLVRDLRSAAAAAGNANPV